MGISRYMQVERLADGKWVYVQPPHRDDENRLWDKRWMSETDNDAFAVLCNDYRRYGNFKLIAPLRGLPTDLSKEIHDSFFGLETSGWCHQWYLLSELLAYDWDQLINIHGELVNPSQYLKLIDGKRLLQRDPKMDAFIESVGIDKARTMSMAGNGVYIGKVDCLQTCRERTPNLQTDIADLRRLGSPDEIRIICWCDD